MIGMFLQKVIQALDAHGVKYALIGGYAVALHGAVRGTVDIDLAVALDKDSFVNVEQALASLELKPSLPLNAEDIHAHREEYMRERNLVVWSFINLNDPLQVVDVLITEDVNEMETVCKKLGEMDLVLASIPELIRMKAAAGRPQDLEDVRALQILL